MRKNILYDECPVCAPGTDIANLQSAWTNSPGEPYPSCPNEGACDGGVLSISLPTHRIVCFACDGRGVTTSHVEGDGGGFTSSEWYEQDQEFREDYMRGVYDRPCPECNGRNVIDVVNEDALDDATREAWWAQLDAEAQDRAIEAAERRAGC